MNPLNLLKPKMQNPKKGSQKRLRSKVFREEEKQAKRVICVEQSTLCLASTRQAQENAPYGIFDLSKRETRFFVGSER